MIRRRSLARLISAAVVVLGVSGSRSALAFPPYRSTDADTADPWWLEARLGLLSLSRDGEDTDYSPPLSRMVSAMQLLMSSSAVAERLTWAMGLDVTR